MMAQMTERTGYIEKTTVSGDFDVDSADFTTTFDVTNP